MPHGILKDQIELLCIGSSMVDPMLDNVEIQSNLYDDHCHIWVRIGYLAPRQ